MSKNYQKLSDEDSQELIGYLERKNPKQRDFAKMLGVQSTAVWAWKNKGEFPAFCKPALDLIKLKEKVKSL